MSFESLEDTNSLYNAIEKEGKSIIVFDIFDTIIHRKIHPEDIKKVSCTRLMGFLNITNTTWEELYSIRANIERDLCQENLRNGNDLEFQFTNFAKLFLKRIRPFIPKDISDDSFINLLEEVEIAAELSCQYIDESVRNTIIRLKKNNLKIICCSDFYLAKTSLLRLLEFHKLNLYIDDIIVSSEYLLTKKTGRLYSILTTRYNRENCLMIGDNPESDCQQAWANGIKSIHLDRRFFHQFYTEQQLTFSEDFFLKKIKIMLRHSDEFLFPEFALSIFHFIKKLYFSLHQKKYKSVFFLAREGQLLEQFFNLFQDNCIVNENLKIKTHYLKVSRRSTFIPSLSKLYDETFFNLFRQYINISYYDFMSSLGFKEHIMNNLASQLSIDKFKKEKDFPRSETFIRLITSDEFIEAYEERRKNQKNNFIEYISGFDGTKLEKLALVDVGWKGTIQDNIKKIVGQPITVEGFYIGLVVPVNNDDPSNLKHGLLFSKNETDKFSGVFDENRSLYEVILAGNHGSAIEYIKIDHQVTVAEEDFSEEKKFYKTSVLPVINTQAKIFELICKEYGKHAINTDWLYTKTAQEHARLVFHPKKNEIAWFLSLYHLENFGVFEKNIFNHHTGKKNIWQKVETYIDYKRNPARYINNVVWPSAELIKHGLNRKQIKYAQVKQKKIFGA